MVGGSTAAVGLTAGDDGGDLQLGPREDWFKRSDLQLALGAGSLTQLALDPSYRPDGRPDPLAIRQVPPTSPPPQSSPPSSAPQRRRHLQQRTAA